MSKYKVRFHLGKGKHYGKFQVTTPKGRKRYHNPLEVQLRIINGTLVNNPKVSEKIHNGEINKTVCSWIECEDVYVLKESLPTAGATEARYNPRWKPNWIVNGEIADSTHYSLLYTAGKRVFIG